MSKAASKSNLRLVEPPVVQVRPVTKANEAMHPRVMSESAFTCARLTRALCAHALHRIAVDVALRLGSWHEKKRHAFSRTSQVA